jgi:hypothetical protein
VTSVGNGITFKSPSATRRASVTGQVGCVDERQVDVTRVAETGALWQVCLIRNRQRGLRLISKRMGGNRCCLCREWRHHSFSLRVSCPQSQHETRGELGREHAALHNVLGAGVASWALCAPHLLHPFRQARSIDQLMPGMEGLAQGNR